MKQSIKGYVTNKSGERKTNDTSHHSLSNTESDSKWRWKDNLFQQSAVQGNLSPQNSMEGLFDASMQKNFSWRAPLSPKDAFYKKFCCVCHQYDNHKDISLWLTCGSYIGSLTNPCWMSCHLECALKDEGDRSVSDAPFMKLDGNIYCLSCGKFKEVLRILRKQLLAARYAKTIVIQSRQILLSQKLLHGIEKYKGLQWVVDAAVKKLKGVGGDSEKASEEMAREIADKLDCRHLIQSICASAVAAIDFMLSSVYYNHNEPKDPPVLCVQFEEVTPTSTVIILKYEIRQFENFLGCRLWHRKSTWADYPENPIYMELQPRKRFLLSKLDPSTKYFCKVSIFSIAGEVNAWEANWKTCPLRGISKDDKCPSKNIPVEIEHCVTTASVPPTAPSLSDRNLEIPSLVPKKQWTKNDYDYCMEVIKLLENKGHIEKDFKVKFLGWFSLKATMHEKRVVCTFVDVLINDLPSLAEQLVDTFMDLISIEK